MSAGAAKRPLDTPEVWLANKRARVEKEGKIEEAPAAAAAAVASSAQVVIRLPEEEEDDDDDEDESSNNDECERDMSRRAAKDVEWTNYLQLLIRYCVDRANHESERTWQLLGSDKEHADALRRFLMNEYTRLQSTSLEHLSLGAVAFVGLCWLTSLQQQPRPTQQKTMPSIDCKPLYRDLVSCPSRSLLEWKATSVAFLNSCAACITYPFGAKCAATLPQIEEAACLYSYMSLQFYYAVLLRTTELSAPQHAARERVVMPWWKDTRRVYLTMQLSDTFDQRFTKIVYEHWMGYGRAGRYYRLYPKGSKRSTAMDMARYVMNPKEVKDFASARTNKMHVLDKIAPKSSSSSSSSSSSTTPVLPPPPVPPPSDIVAVVDDLFMLLVGAHAFEQQARIPAAEFEWFEFYYMTPFAFVHEHKRILEAKRWKRETRRPLIVMLLGRYAVCTHDMRVFWCPSAEDAVLTWNALVLTEHDGRLENPRYRCPCLFAS